MSSSVHDLPSEEAERRRCEWNLALDASRRAVLGQYFTPLPAARLIASMLTLGGRQWVRVLDPGAGIGSLTAAAVEHLANQGIHTIDIVAWEMDEALHGPLRATLKHCAAWAADRNVSVGWELQGGDYIEATAGSLIEKPGAEGEHFDAIVMNPPYRKVNVGTPERVALERVGLPISNLYTAFLALATTQLEMGGVLAAITPRSFTNGPYAAPFRHFFFSRVGIERLHLFESRAHVFADTGVLQENLIFSTRRGSWPATVRLSCSHGLDDPAKVREIPAEEVMRRDDPELFLRIPNDERDREIAALMHGLPLSLEELGISVSTGKVVEFRAREHLRIEPQPGDAPLIRPNHLKRNAICWPDMSGRGRPNALAIEPASRKLLLPNGTFVLVKRLTAKEEKRRVRAAVCDPSIAPGSQIAFENHLNVFHRKNKGLPDQVAHGLAAYLNSSFVDLYVRQFSGHTQVNATDLRHLRYPSLTSLSEVGAIARTHTPPSQKALDDLVDRHLLSFAPGALRKVA